MDDLRTPPLHVRGDAAQEETFRAAGRRARELRKELAVTFLSAGAVLRQMRAIQAGLPKLREPASHD